MIPGHNSEIWHPKAQFNLPILHILDDQFAKAYWKYVTHKETYSVYQ